MDTFLLVLQLLCQALLGAIGIRVSLKSVPEKYHTSLAVFVSVVCLMGIGASVTQQARNAAAGQRAQAALDSLGQNLSDARDELKTLRDQLGSVKTSTDKLGAGPLPVEIVGQQATSLPRIQNAPHGVIVGGDVTVQGAPLLIQDFVLRLSVGRYLAVSGREDIRTQGARAKAFVVTHAGTRHELVATQDTTVNVRADNASASMTLTPAAPSELLGRPIEYLATFDTLVVMPLLGANMPGETTDCDVVVDLRVNGTEMFTISSRAACELLFGKGYAIPLGVNVSDALAKYKALPRR
jgi:hypothetical protein